MPEGIPQEVKKKLEEQVKKMETLLKAYRKIAKIKEEEKKK